MGTVISWGNLNGVMRSNKILWSRCAVVSFASFGGPGIRGHRRSFGIDFEYLFEHCG